MTDQPTRLVRARDLIKGATVVIECTDPPKYCPYAKETHGAAGPAEHLLTMYDVETNAGEVTVIAFTETGGQAAWQAPGHRIVRVIADTMPLDGDDCAEDDR